jgi:hypothetical protein
MNLTLSDFDGRLMDGFLFCKKVYEFFDQVQQAPGGVLRLRRRPSHGAEKKLLEELLPIARYVQQRYRVGLRLKVRCVGGNQQYDAELLCSGGYVDREFVPSRMFLEVTSVMHEKEHLRRELLDTLFGVGDIRRDPKTKEVISRPRFYDNHEADDNMFAWIQTRIGKEQDQLPGEHGTNY